MGFTTSMPFSTIVWHVSILSESKRLAIQEALERIPGLLGVAREVGGEVCRLLSSTEFSVDNKEGEFVNDRALSMGVWSTSIQPYVFCGLWDNISNEVLSMNSVVTT